MTEMSALAELLAVLVRDPRTVLLIVLLVIAAYIDLRTYRIPNWLTAGGTAAGVLFAAVQPMTGHPDWLHAAIGMGLGLAVMLPAYLLRVMGAGDVKLMAMVGTFLGPEQVFAAALVTFIVGGVLALVYMVVHGVTARLLANVGSIVRYALFSVVARMSPVVALSPTQSVGRLPYGVSIACGTAAYLVMRQLGYL